ncbi:MAG TPA: thiamine-phosphate kinase [Terriglobia bacterium]|nr:thiamine-phosphate kinase [Terriglobia bacterium]
MFRNESEFVRWLRGLVAKDAGPLKLGIGDDAALVEVARGNQAILTTDLSIEGVHFLPRLHPPRAVGHRALARALSDVAAMGGTPRFALVSLAISRRTSRAWVKDFYAGLLGLAARLGVTLIGGDTAVVKGGISADVIAVGEAPRGKALRRSGARPGDQIFVSGKLGLSALGLRLLRSGRAGKAASEKQALFAHLYPEPRCALGRYLSERRLATACIDLSDGLSTDLAHLCEASGVGARVWASRMPLPEVPGESSINSLQLALSGGEDYELLFSVPRGKAARIPHKHRGVTLHRIGEISHSRKLVLIQSDAQSIPLVPAGHDHFRNI